MRYLYISFFLMIIGFPVHAQTVSGMEKVIGSYPIPGMVVNKQEGLFVRLHNEIMTRTQLSLKFIIEPTQRIQQSFKSNRLIGYFPELWQHIPKEKPQIIVSDNIWLKSVIIFTLKTEPKISQISDLEGLRIGAVRGYSYGQIEKNKNIEIQYVRSDKQNINKLMSGRVDAIIGDNTSTVSAIKNSKFAHIIYYDLQQPIDILEAFYIFQNTVAGREILNKVNAAIESLKQEGVIKLNEKTGESQILFP